MIKECPLCGGEATLKDTNNGKIRQGWIGCPKCQCYINWKISPEGAIAKWNRRAYEKAIVKASKSPCDNV